MSTPCSEMCTVTNLAALQLSGHKASYFNWFCSGLLFWKTASDGCDSSFCHFDDLSNVDLLATTFHAWSGPMLKNCHSWTHFAQVIWCLISFVLTLRSWLWFPCWQASYPDSGPWRILSNFLVWSWNAVCKYNLKFQALPQLVHWSHNRPRKKGKKKPFLSLHNESTYHDIKSIVCAFSRSICYTAQGMSQSGIFWPWVQVQVIWFCPGPILQYYIFLFTLFHHLTLINRELLWGS